MHKLASTVNVVVNVVNVVTVVVIVMMKVTSANTKSNQVEPQATFQQSHHFLVHTQSATCCSFHRHCCPFIMTSRGRVVTDRRQMMIIIVLSVEAVEQLTANSKELLCRHLIIMSVACCTTMQRFESVMEMISLAQGHRASSSFKQQQRTRALVPA